MREQKRGLLESLLRVKVNITIGSISSILGRKRLIHIGIFRRIIDEVDSRTRQRHSLG